MIKEENKFFFLYAKVNVVYAKVNVISFEHSMSEVKSKF